MPVVAGDFILDFTGMANVNPYTHPDLNRVTPNGAQARIVGGVLIPSYAGGRVALYYNGATTDEVTVEVTVSHDSSNFSDYSAIVFIDSVGTGYALIIKGNQVQILKITTANSFSAVSTADFSNRTYAAGEKFSLTYNSATSELTSRMAGTVVATRTDTSHSALDLKPGVFIVGDNAGSKGIYELGITGTALPASIAGVNGGADVTQYQQGVPVAYENMDPATITAMTLNGTAVTYDALGQFNALGSLPSGLYTLEVTTPTAVITADVPYLRTHPIEVPPAGTSVHADSVFGQMGNPGGRYISLTKPAALLWKAPHDEFTAANCALNIANVLEAPSDAPPDQSYDVTGSLIDPDGVTQAFTIAATVDLADPVDPPPGPGTPGNWPFGLNLSWLTSGWTWGRRHPKTNQRVRKWMGQ